MEAVVMGVVLVEAVLMGAVVMGAVLVEGMLMGAVLVEAVLVESVMVKQSVLIGTYNDREDFQNERLYSCGSCCGGRGSAVHLKLCFQIFYHNIIELG